MKTNTQMALFTDESRSTVDCPDGWSSGGARSKEAAELCFGPESWGGVGLPEGVKMTSAKNRVSD